MKKILALVLTACMLMGTSAALAQTATSAEKPTELVIGATTEMSGFFYTDLWGSNTSDMDVRGLIHGYATVAWQTDGAYALDETVVDSFEAGAAATGGKLYRITLKKDLQWNDGTPITAQDYLFSILLQSSPELAALGVNQTSYAQLQGQERFAQNSAAPFSGVHLIDDYSFSLTVKNEYLPYFYELVYVNVQPTPIAVVAPGIQVADDGDGAYLTPKPVAEGETPAVFSTELLRSTLLGEAQDGYVYAPHVTCGPYTLTGYDPVEHVATFAKNPYYKGNYEGQKPEMETLVFRPVTNENMMEELESGRVDIVNKAMDSQKITEGLAKVAEGSLSYLNYLRSGYSFLAFACEEPTAAQLSVRKALAMSIDVDALCTEVLEGYAMPVYGFYGLGQWMASQDTERLSQLDRYGYDPLGARSLLEQDGWIYNQDGKPYTQGKDDMRYKMQDGVMIPLELRWAKVPESTGIEPMERQLKAAAENLGMKLTIVEMSFSEMLEQYYRQTERQCNLFYLASNFGHVFDPYFAFNTADEYQGVANTSGLRDEQLMKLALDMRSVEAGDTESYLEKWFAFQERWVELEPMIPLYSNVYFDFFRPDLYGYNINTSWGWSAAILYATFTEPVPQETDGLTGQNDVTAITVNDLTVIPQ